mmetsp:Transcript_4866/g.15837  ORF Transcript_4866/g.15837 Transcript_4866/m.15837 type:complete len:251 (+) Transcript_4866:509-1261(+)
MYMLPLLRCTFWPSSVCISSGTHGSARSSSRERRSKRGEAVRWPTIHSISSATSVMAYRWPPAESVYPNSASSGCEMIRFRWFFRLKWGSGKQMKILLSWPFSKKFGMNRIALLCSAHTFSYVAASAASAAVACAASCRRARARFCTYSTSFGRISMPRTSWDGKVFASERQREPKPHPTSTKVTRSPLARCGKYSPQGTSCGRAGNQKSLALSTLECARERKCFFCGICGPLSSSPSRERAPVIARQHG